MRLGRGRELYLQDPKGHGEGPEPPKGEPLRVFIWAEAGVSPLKGVLPGE